MRYSFTAISHNAKTGPIAVTMTEHASCPPSCPLRDNGCYASAAGHIGMHWRNLDKRGLTLRQLTAQIRRLAPGRLWRHNVAGDFATRGQEQIDRRAVIEITRANTGRRGFAYTHALPRVGANAQIIEWANNRGFTINLSADNLIEADAFAEWKIGPVVTVLPSDQTENTRTPAGRSVVICPNHRDKRVQCIDCQLCQKADRKTIIGFPAHGSKQQAVNAVFHNHP